MVWVPVLHTLLSRFKFPNLYTTPGLSVSFSFLSCYRFRFHCLPFHLGLFRRFRIDKDFCFGLLLLFFQDFRLQLGFKPQVVLLQILQVSSIPFAS
ncbi:hypothetical protein L6452_05667 [Arctium lappa]|uniref:Uncharacterized protein n=1 Tax=Arctium lappa TaxID=4217 RepID=A0ACB9EHP9_ARCLA|nr:hypothetical protein L6452_05667 [Arctium lappa]